MRKQDIEIHIKDLKNEITGLKSQIAELNDWAGDGKEFSVQAPVDGVLETCLTQYSFPGYSRKFLLIWVLCAIIAFIAGKVSNYFPILPVPQPAPVVELDGTRREFLKKNLERYHDHRNKGDAQDVAAEVFIQNTSPIFKELEPVDLEPQAALPQEATEPLALSKEEREYIYRLFENTPPPRSEEPSEPVPITCKNCIEAQREPAKNPVARAPPRRGLFRR